MADITLDNLLADIYRRDKNFLSFIEGIQSVYDSNNESIEITWEKENGDKVTKKLPSLAHILNKIKLLENNNKAISDVSMRAVKIKLPNGEIRPIISAEPIQSPDSFNFPKVIKNFSIRENQLKDKLLEPYTVIEVPIDESTYSGFDDFGYLKLVLGEDDNSINYFNDKLKENIVNYTTLIKNLESNNITYSRVTGTLKLPPRTLKNIGNFSVIAISKESISKIEGNEIVYELSSVRYKDSNNRDLILKSGMRLIYNKSTIYEIKNVLASERKVTLRLIEGSQPILKGSNNLKIYSEKANNNLEIPIGSEKRFVLFVKPISPNGKILNTDWGTGNGINIYELKDSNGTNFFDGLTVDLWEGLKAISESGMVSASRIITPRIPQITSNNFSVELLNSHKNEVKNTVRLRDLNVKKNETLSEVDSINIEISTIREKLSDSTLDSNTIKSLQQEDLKLQEKHEITSKIIKSTSNEIVELANTVVDYKPKYALVGLIPYPEPVYQDPKNRKGRQDIIALELEYRYVGVDDNIQEFQSKQIKLASKKVVSFTPSKWIKYGEQVRKIGKSRNFIDEKLSDPNTATSNQYSIPISENEKVQIRVRSISNAGYPIKQVVSDWSEVLTISFPEELKEKISKVLEDSKQEKQRSEFSGELDRLKLTNHASDAFDNKDVKFKHHANFIATNKKTPEQGNLSVQAVLDTLGLDIESIKQILNSGSGNIGVRLLDENEREIQVIKNNSTVLVDGGFYSEQVSNLNIKKGAILEKKFYIEIENNGDGDMELISYVPGKLTVPLTATYDGYVFNLNEYLQYRRYDNAPISLLDVSSTYLNDFTFGKFFQNKQTQGQRLFSRNRDISLNEKLYEEDTIGIWGLNVGTTEPIQPFIWNGSLTSSNPNGGGRETDFCVHIEHPSLALNSNFMNNFGTYNVAGFFPDKNFDVSNNSYVFPIFSQSRYSSKDITEVGYLKQLYSKEYTRVTSGATLQDQIFKNRFEPEDQYLIGKKTCGLYINLAESSREKLEVGGNFYNEGEIIKKGSKILIPIITSSRLTDYYGSGSSGIGNIGGVSSNKNVRFEKKIGIDILVKIKQEQKLFSFDFQYGIQYQSSNI